MEQLHTSYASLGRDFKGTFDELVRQLKEQQNEAERLRDTMVDANKDMAEKNSTSTTKLASLIEEERTQQANEREALLSQISALVNSTTKKQQDRVAAALDGIRGDFDSQRDEHVVANSSFVTNSQSWALRSQDVVNKVIESRESIKMKIKSDFAVSSIIELHTMYLLTSSRLLMVTPKLCVRSRNQSTIPRSIRSRNRCNT